MYFNYVLFWTLGHHIKNILTRNFRSLIDTSNLFNRSTYILYGIIDTIRTYVITFRALYTSALQSLNTNKQYIRDNINPYISWIGLLKPRKKEERRYFMDKYMTLKPSIAKTEATPML